MGKVFHLVYISEAAEDLGYSDLQEILAVSRTKNARDNITGCLIYRDGYFLQLLEGEEDAVKRLANKIRFDSRNSNLRVLITTTSTERLFGDWSMAFFDGDISTPSTQHLIDLFESCTNVDGDQRFLIIPILKKFRASAPEFK